MESFMLIVCFLLIQLLTNALLIIIQTHYANHTTPMS